MESKDITSYFEKPCKFKLRGGKEVFGVIWKERENEIYFTSSSEFQQYKQQQNSNISKYTISPDDVMYAEMLRDLDTLDN